MNNQDLSQLFAEVGDAINQRWEQAGFDWKAFPQIAEAALQDDSPLLRVSREDLYRWTLTAPQLPKQHDLAAKFAQPPITAYSNERFHIAFLFWTTSTTAIHQHSFEGAFRVFLGSSIQATYRFAEEQRWGDHLLRGRIELQSMQLLPIGAVCAIEYGDSYIHSIYHLDNPSITLIVRTNGRPADQVTPQYNYEYPGFGTNPFHRSEKIERAKQVLSHLHLIDDPQFANYFGEALRAANAFGVFQLLDHVQSLGLAKLLPAVLEELRARFGEGFADAIPDFFREKERATRLIQARQTLTDPEGRFFLALLLNVIDRAHFLALLAERFPDSEPSQVIARWVNKLLEMKMLGLESSFSGMLVRGMLAGLPPEEVVRKLTPILRTEAAINAVRAHGAELVYLFRPIFDAAITNRAPAASSAQAGDGQRGSNPAAQAVEHAGVD